MFSQIPSHVASKIRPNAVTGCSEWIGARDSWGYGNIPVQHRVSKAHRALYDLLSEPAGRSRWLTVVAASSGSPSAESSIPAAAKRAFPPANLSAATTAL